MRRLSTPPMPREHGAWGMLLIPFLVAAGTAGVCNAPLALLLASMLSFYVARTAWLEGRRGWTIGLLAASAAAALPLLLVWQLWWLAAFGSVAAALAFRTTERGLGERLVAVAGLTLSGPSAWYAATSGLGREAWLLWLLTALYFAGGLFYVRMHFAAARRRGRSEAVRASLLVHAGLAALPIALALGGVVSWIVALAFAPVVVRAAVGAWRLTPALRIKRLGWTELVHSLVFALLLVIGLRA